MRATTGEDYCKAEEGAVIKHLEAPPGADYSGLSTEDADFLRSYEDVKGKKVIRKVSSPFNYPEYLY